MRDIYLMPFATDLFFAVFIAILLIALIIYVITILLRHVRKKCDLDRAEILRIKILDAWMSSFAIMCMQGEFQADLACWCPDRDNCQT